MFKLNQGGLRLFRLFGIDVYLHWMWALVAFFEIQARSASYSSLAWNVAEYCSLFAIVLTHEFGHALACRSVGGRAERILLWPLGGVAYVQPPPRPGALLWSIAAGPLVNVVLLPPTMAAAFFVSRSAGVSPDMAHYFTALAGINAVILVFNLLPVYPLDGGQILQALLWFVIGRSRSLMVVAVLGFVAAAAVLVAAVATGSVWFGVMALFGGLQAVTGMRQARLLARLAAIPRRNGVACPRCGAAPPIGDLWRCVCGQSFDTFAAGGACPHCGNYFAATPCTECHQPSPHQAYYSSASAGAPSPPEPFA